ncbi:MAG: DNA-directed RNA polymerase, subunit E'' [Candidatus Micrarchaeota archaeon]|nr:DNA-directed RNA polymerase, subunit E'' [Candidatus Micrarchaeota archaeon]
MKACRSCRAIVEKSDTCALCGSKDLTTEFSGLIIVIDPNSSEIAKKLNITVPGKYATNIK